MQNKRIVVKIGTSTLAHPSGLLNIRQVESLCKVLSDLKNAGHELILGASRGRKNVRPRAGRFFAGKGA